MDGVIIRPIEKRDNALIAKIIRSVLDDFGVPKEGTTQADIALDRMFETYNEPSAIYWVVELDGELVGGAGIKQLENYTGPVCELQKMYFLPSARGKGLGKKVLDMCIEKAKSFGYEGCYLETMPYMEAATKLYESNDFAKIDGPMGDTGHYGCSVHMLRDLR